MGCTTSIGFYGRVVYPLDFCATKRVLVGSEFSIIGYARFGELVRMIDGCDIGKLNIIQIPGFRLSEVAKMSESSVALPFSIA